MMYDKRDMRYKYMNDTQFKNLVDMFESFLHRADFTPSEVREAAMMACINYELSSMCKVHRPRPLLEIALNDFHRAMDEELRKQANGE